MTEVSFTIPDEKLPEFDALVVLTGLRTRPKLINAAFTLLQWAVKEGLAGRRVGSQGEISGVFKEVVMPGLNHDLEENARRILAELPPQEEKLRPVLTELLAPRKRRP